MGIMLLVLFTLFCKTLNSTNVEVAHTNAKKRQMRRVKKREIVPQRMKPPTLTVAFDALSRGNKQKEKNEETIKKPVEGTQPCHFGTVGHPI